MPKIELNISHEEFDTLLYLLADRYEQALTSEQNSEGRQNRRENSPEPVSSSPEDAINPAVQDSQIIKSVEDKLVRAWIG